MNGLTQIAENFNKVYEKENPENVLEYFLKEFSGHIALASSFGVEDQVLTHMVASIDPKTEIFTLDTGRLHEETYRTWEKTEKRYGIKIRAYYPDYNSLEQLVRDQGINGFYESIENRKRCCEVRKIEPLKRALKDKKAWITGLRREQSVTRSDARLIEYDTTFGLIKLNPLFEWKTYEVWEYIRKNDIPYNSLHDRGFPSIGCEPCTRAVKEGEDIRSGRWWWEEPEHKECGLHIKR
ncbi:phosphoadenylyl-sulfate reductase [Nitrosophilus alvini]|uniref:phosphoadenylyl-sulfate reductase n=1 Tax=Nitrosophilus alvini TaxID=2714855 RepID=UPI00190D4C1A|nr:phosphoadenylyl-sulfate reductase [Nitrosophilus alvini]